MGVQVPPSQVSHIIVTGHFGPAREHDSGALQGIAGGPLIEHQGDPRIGKNVPGVHRKPRNQQNRRAIGVAGKVHQGAIGIAATGHQGRQSPLPATPEQRPHNLSRIEIGGQLHRYSLAILLQQVPFFG
jgi:hypothetical protein